MNHITAHILKHLMTTAPILVGLLVIICAVCSYEYSWTGMIHFIVCSILGGGLIALGCVILDFFEN